MKAKTTTQDLGHAVIRRDRKAVEKLLAEGLDPNGDPSTHFFTPLQYAAERNLVQIAHLLLSKGAQVDATYELHTENNRFFQLNKPLEITYHNKHDSMMLLLLEHGANASKVLRLAIKRKDYHTIIQIYLHSKHFIADSTDVNQLAGLWGRMRLWSELLKQTSLLHLEQQIKVFSAIANKGTKLNLLFGDQYIKSANEKSKAVYTEYFGNAAHKMVAMNKISSQANTPLISISR